MAARHCQNPPSARGRPYEEYAPLGRFEKTRRDERPVKAHGDEPLGTPRRTRENLHYLRVEPLLPDRSESTGPGPVMEVSFHGRKKISSEPGKAKTRSHCQNPERTVGHIRLLTPHARRNIIIYFSYLRQQVKIARDFS